MNESPLDLLTATPKRERVHDQVMNTKVPKSVKLLVEHEADLRKVSTSAIVREALAEYLGRRGY